MVVTSPTNMEFFRYCTAGNVCEQNLCDFQFYGNFANLSIINL